MEDKEAKRLLRKARKLLIDKGWTTKHFARDKYSHACEPTSKRACRFCILGAVEAASNDWPKRCELKNILEIHLESGISCAEFNDTPGRKKSEVLDLFDRTIASL